MYLSDCLYIRFRN